MRKCSFSSERLSIELNPQPCPINSRLCRQRCSSEQHAIAKLGGTGWVEAVAKAVELFGIYRVDGKAPVEASFHENAAWGFNRDGDVIVLAFETGEDLVEPGFEGSGFVWKNTFFELFARWIYDTKLMILASSVQAD